MEIKKFESHVDPEQEKMNEVPTFKMFVKSYFPFIEDTMEALDNYGLLCKVVEYLNQVISNENAQIDNIESLYNAFNEFKTEVETYINTDVLPDIEESINEAIEYMQTNLVQTVNTLFNEAIEQGLIQAYLREDYDSSTESLILSIGLEGSSNE